MDIEKIMHNLDNRVKSFSECFYDIINFGCKNFAKIGSYGPILEKEIQYKL